MLAQYSDCQRLPGVPKGEAANNNSPWPGYDQRKLILDRCTKGIHELKYNKTQCGRLREFLADERLRESSLPKNGNQELFGEEGSWRGRTCWKPLNILITPVFVFLEQKVMNGIGPPLVLFLLLCVPIFTMALAGRRAMVMAPTF